MKLYPNLYICLVGGPGSGKSVAISGAREYAQDKSCKDYVKVISDSITREAFFVQMEKAYFVKLKKEVAEDAVDELDAKHSSISVMSPELGAFLQSKNMPFIRAIADLYDCDRPGDVYAYLLKQADSSVIQKPWLALLGGTTPDDLAEILPKAAVGQGFTSRLILVWSDDEYETDDIFRVNKKSDKLKADLLYDYHKMLEMHGEFVFENDAEAYMNEWYQARHKTMPIDPMLLHYAPRRLQHYIKLCMVASASRTQEMLISVDDCKTAWDWLQGAEKEMARCLKGVGYNALSDQIPLAVEFIYKEYAKTGKPVKERSLRMFLNRNVSADKIFAYMNEVEAYCMVVGESPTREFSPAAKEMPEELKL